jgi:2-aminoadipate transaminase
MQTAWEQRYAQRVQRMKSSAIRELLKVTQQPDTISFAGGLPAPEVFPVEQVAAAARRVLRDSGPQALQYSATEGYRPLREMIASRLGRDGLNVTLDNVLITSGSQQGLDLLGKLFIDPGDTVLVEAPTYMGALQSWNPYGAEYSTLPCDEHGVDTERLEQALQAGPKCMYVLPTFQNPTGVTLSIKRRLQLVSAARRYGVPVIEDDPYSQLRFEGEDLPNLLVLDSDQERDASGYQGNVIYMSTFSKVLAPGLRLGWLVAPAQVVGKLVQAKQGTDLHTSSFTQMLVYELARDGFLEAHAPLIRRVYRERRDVMLAALAREFPTGVTWTHPEGGMFLWLTLPEGIDTTAVLQEAVEHKVVFVPGQAFYPNGGGANTMRLNFSHPSPDMIDEGIARLARVVRRSMDRVS